MEFTRLGIYVLDKNGQPVPERDVLKWGRWMETKERILWHDRVEGVLVSTIFLGVNHGWGKEGLILWETMIFPVEGKWAEDYQRRYASRQAALKGHLKVLRILRIFSEGKYETPK
jgi:hypothetical protein